MKQFVKNTIISLGFLFATISFAQAETIDYVGSSTVGTYMTAAAASYTKAQFQINTEPESGGGENAIASGNNDNDLGGVAREVRPEILARGVQKHLIGYDAIGVWINRDNPLNDLTLDQLKGIFSGNIQNWKEVGGPDAGINLYIVNPQSATRKVFSSHVLGETPYGGNIKTVRPDPAIIAKVAADPHGVGQLSFAIGNGQPQVQFVKKLAINGQEASVMNPTYPISRPLHLITSAAPKPSVKAFIEWTLSPAGQKILTQFFVGIEQ